MEAIKDGTKVVIDGGATVAKGLADFVWGLIPLK
jgi:hypothetical protein